VPVQKPSSTARLIDLLLKIKGSTEAAAAAIGCSPAELQSWQSDLGKPDQLQFERMIDVIMNFQHKQIRDHDETLRYIREQTKSPK
jgi:hypothetical protein